MKKFLAVVLFLICNQAFAGHLVQTDINGTWVTIWAPDWNGGHWYRGQHRNVNGVWWVHQDNWTYYPQYDNQPPITNIPHPPTQTPWYYYCPSAGLFYPNVTICQTGWQLVPTIPPDVR